ncbi:MAG: tripartite tricarboxylate transporter substrate binding protein [Hyphomicrobium sp.]
MNRRALLIATMAVTAASAASGSALAQSSPSGPLRFIVPTPPGSPIEPYARLISEHMARKLSRVAIVEHKPGASTMLAAQHVANSPADGNMILIATQGMVEIIPTAGINRKWSMDDFIPLIRGVIAPLMLVTHPSVPARTFPELIAWIKKNPGKLTYSSYDLGTPSHFLGFQLNERFGLDLLHVPSRGSPAQSTNLLGGHVLFGFAQVQASLPLIRDGKLNAIAVTSATRSRHAPEIPSMTELGSPEFTSSIWFGLMIRSGAPSNVVTGVLNAAKAAHVDPDVRTKLEAQGYEISGETGPQFAADIKAQTERWARLIKAAGFKAD